MSLIHDVLEYIGYIFFPSRCIFCDRLTEMWVYTCPECADSLPWIEGEVCSYCGAEKAVCQCSGRHGSYFDASASALYYTGTVKDCIRRFKFDGIKNTYTELSSLMAQTCRKRYGDIEFDYVAYVPMDKKREKQRGFNQSMLLAKGIAEELNIPFGKNLLIKLYRTDVQHELNEVERKGNLLGAFDVSSAYNLEGRTVLLVDDVKTSGATLNECGKMLYLNGAERVFCLTAALVNSKIDEKQKGEGD